MNSGLKSLPFNKPSDDSSEKLTRDDHTDCHQKSRNTSEDICKFPPVASRTKSAIVTLALWHLLPVGVATWLIKKGGLRNA